MKRLAVAVAAAAVLALPASAQALPGPPLQTPQSALDASLGCDNTVAASSKTPILLVHGGNGSADQWIGNYRQVLPRAGYPTCWVTIPGRGLNDVQESAEYVVHAIRTVNDRARRPIAVVGHSFGGLMGSYVLRFWPDLARRVDDFVGLAGVYGNGTEAAVAVCVAACPVAARQISPGSRLLDGYSRRPLYPGPSFTTVGTRNDELVTPQPAAGRLDGARNYVVQDACPGRFVDHVSIVLDNFAYRVVLDAISNPGPGQLGRLADPCAGVFMPGADPAGILPDVIKFGFGLGTFVEQRNLPEPALRCYIDPGCRKTKLRPSLRATVTARRARPSGAIVRTAGTVVQPPGALDLCSGRVTIRILRGRRTLSLRRAAVAPDCTFSLRRRVRATRGQALRVRLRYAGSRELRPAERRVTRKIR